MNKIYLLVLVFIATKSYGWDFGAKFDLQQSSTDNVNLTTTGAVKDSYGTYSGYVQAKNDSWRYRVKLKTEKYKTVTTNNSSSSELSVQYKRTKTNDFNLSVFKQSYPNTSLVNNDTSSDNSGGSLATTLKKDFDKDTNGYLTLSGTNRKYPNIANRTDTNLGVILGVEHTIETNFLMNPEFNLQSNKSTNTYYSTVSLGPSLLLSYTPNDNWEIFSDISYSYTRYSNRPFKPTAVPGKKAPAAQAEHQDLTSIDVGGVYSFLKWFSFQAKYTKNSNASNNPASEYKADVVNFDLGIRI